VICAPGAAFSSQTRAQQGASTGDGILKQHCRLSLPKSPASLVAEDNGDMQIVALSAGGVTPIVQVEGHRESEVAGPAFDPSGTRLYFSSQRGASGHSSDGVTYEVSGAFTTS
jgi:hypothetical protein